MKNFTTELYKAI